MIVRVSRSSSHRSLLATALAVGVWTAGAGAAVALPARAAVAQQGTRPAAAATAADSSTRGTTTAAAGKRRTKKKTTAPVRLTAKMRLTREMESAARQVRAALVIQDTATLSHWWADEYTYTAPSGETFSKWERLEAIMSPGFVGEDQAEVLPSELDIVRRYGDVVIVSSRLGLPSVAAGDGNSAAARSRAGRTQLLTVWVRQGDRWRTVASQATAVAGPPPVAPPPAPKKKKGH